MRHQPGRKPHAGVEAQKQVGAWVAAQPDLTLAELQAKLHREAGVVLSRGRVWYLEPVMSFVLASPLESVNDVDDLGLGKAARPRIPLQSVPEEEFARENRSY